MADPEFRLLDAPSVIPLIRLEMAPGDDNFVAPNSVTMAQSLFDKSARIFGIWEADEPVGLIAICDMSHPDADLDEGDDPNGVYVWRLMIGAKHKGRGLGSAAIAFAEAEARRLGRAQVVLSAVPEDNSPIPFYIKQGFRKTGRIIDDEVELIKRL